MRERLRVPHVLQRPEQGWSSLLLLLGMLFVLGISVSDSRVLPLGGEDHTGSLVGVMLAAGLIGFLLARSSIGVVRAHVLGATAGAVVLILLAAAAVTNQTAVLPADLTDLQERVMALRLQLDASLELWRGDNTEIPTVVTYLVFGAICWTTAQFSAFSIFRYDRGGPAVMAIGVVLFLNVGLWPSDRDAELLPVWPVLAAFSMMAMLLLMRLQLSSQGKHWMRRHIADAGDVRRLFLRTGTAFVIITVVAASSMTIVAKAPPQDVPVEELEDVLSDLGVQLAAWLPIIGVTPEEPDQGTVDDEYDIQDRWEEAPGAAFEVAFLDGALRGNYWWLQAHSDFENESWRRDVIDTDRVRRAELIPPGQAFGGSRHGSRASVTLRQPTWPGSVLVLPEARTLSEDVDVDYIDKGREYAGINFQERSDLTPSYEIQADLWDYNPDGVGLTSDALAATGDVYDEWLDPYLIVHPSGTGELTQELAERVRDEHPTPYEQALALQKHFTGGDYTYEPQLEACVGNTPECLLQTRVGFCQQYATTMAMVLREMGIPSRMILGYLPGDQQAGGTWVVPNAALHNWVEAWFPGYGWIRFDPTPGNRFGPVRTDFQEAPDGGVPGPTQPPTQEPGPTGPVPTPEPSFGPLPPEPLGPDSGDDGALAAIVIGGGVVGLLVVVMIGLLFARLRRLPGSDSGLAFSGIISLATRLGYAPHPSQTEYEYAGTLADVVPNVRDDLFYVADVHVESAYGDRKVDSDRQHGLKGAYARIRTALLRLWMRARR